MKVAITGKGGVGKTTLSSTLARLYADEGRTVLAADVDPDANLGLALGMTEEEVNSIVPVSKMKQLAKERTGAKTPQALWQTYPLRITRDLAQRTVGRHVRLRSAYRGSGGNAFRVYSSGYVSTWYAIHAYRCAPACKMTNLVK